MNIQCAHTLYTPFVEWITSYPHRFCNGKLVVMYCCYDSSVCRADPDTYTLLSSQSRIDNEWVVTTDLQGSIRIQIVGQI